ncbi:hypothetical protein ROSEINA2194_03279 [Roseburia inulinivorans DSM 16841]|uniref:Uncharacterized protein n=1 Tax=Roseburia inulinivorans DSM 16841 TaxID=622312 RepID=C0FX00_9FIRM|nr:hypothetical protein ROSEINA2194_03279 [Roseburia inulinivorans DSM 16841]
MYHFSVPFWFLSLSIDYIITYIILNLFEFCFRIVNRRKSDRFQLF